MRTFNIAIVWQNKKKREKPMPKNVKYSGIKARLPLNAQKK